MSKEKLDFPDSLLLITATGCRKIVDCVTPTKQSRCLSSICWYCPPPPDQTLARVKRQRQPDQAEADQFGARKCFAVQKDPQQKLNGRPGVLQNANQGKGNAPRASRKEQQGDRRKDP